MGARGEETSAVHRSGESVTTKLRRIAEKARRELGFKFTSLYHLMNEDLLTIRGRSGDTVTIRDDPGTPYIMTIRDRSGDRTDPGTPYIIRIVPRICSFSA